jgi:glutaredoxin
LRSRLCGSPSAFSSQAAKSVKKVKLSTRPAMIRSGLRPVAPPASRTGSTGSTHGEIAVTSPASRPMPSRTSTRLSLAGNVHVTGVLELYQAEWCPYSHRVRQRLTELGIEFVARQVEADPDERAALRKLSGETSIPVLVDGDTVVTDPDRIVAYLDERHEFRPDAADHRAKAIEEAELLGQAPPAWP